MNFKELVKTKVFWLGILAIAGGIIEAVFDGWQQGVDKMLIGAAMIGGRKAVPPVAEIPADE